MLAMSVIERAGRVLAEAAQSPARVILFGSSARGNADANSDLDFLVIERTVDDRIAEAVRLRRALGAQLRYDEAPAPLDRSDAIVVASSAVAWARSLLDR